MKKSLIIMFSLLIFGCSTSSYISKQMGTINIWLPKHDWSIMFLDKNIEVLQEKTSPNGDSGYFLFSNNTDKITFSFYIEPAPKGATSAKLCRDIAWAKTLFSLQSRNAISLNKSDENDRYSSEYIIPEFEGKTVNQKNWNIHYYRNGYWIDLHLSKMNYEKVDDEIVSNFVSKVIITE